MNSLPLQISQPWWLLVLLALPLFVLLARWSRSGLERGQSIAGTVLRVLLFLALTLSLADATWMSKSYRTATIFLLDHSHSIPQDTQKGAIEWINARLKERPKDDVAGVILFGAEAMIEVPPSDHPEPVGPNSIVVRSATDIGAAIRLALAVFPQGYQRRIVVVTDGNENRGHAAAEAELARAHGVIVDVLPLHYEYPNEVWLESLHVPPDLLPKEPFDLTAVVNAQRPGPAKLHIYRNNQLLVMTDVQLNKGKNVFTVKQKVEVPGSYTYRAVVEMAGDTVSQNNESYAFAGARGEARIAVVAGEPADGERLVKALGDEGLLATALVPEQITRNLSELAGFDAIIFANVEAAQLTKAAMQAVEAAVHDAGVGFIMIGGEKSFGPGGYRGSPIEELLPVTMEQPQRRVLPNGALCLILHTCEIAEGNYWAKQIGIAALNVLNTKDYMGVLVYGMGGESWLFPMQQVDKKKMSELIRGASPGDMPSFDNTMQMAHNGLKGVNAASKHCVIISDADPSGPSRALVDAMVKDKITISTIAISPHSGSDVEKMDAIARVAKGRFYNVTDPSTLPQIFIKEAATLQRSMIIEGRIQPSKLGGTQALTGIAGDEIPPVHGYTLTNPKVPLARVSLGLPVAAEGGGAEPGQFDPLLAEWQYGLGKTMAFTSDAKARWGKEWVAWPKYQKFWSQAVRSVLRTVPRAPYSVQTEIEGGRGKVIVDAVDENGKFVHTLQFAGSATSPGGTKKDLTFRQVGPGRYEAEFDAAEVGVYSVNGSFKDGRGQTGFITQGVPLSYVPEYRDLKTNVSLLTQIQERTGGRRLAADTPVYVPLKTSAGMAMPLWPILLVFLLIAFPIDVFVRRVAVEWGALGRKVRSLVTWRREKPTAAVPATLAALAAKKQEVRAELDEAREERPPVTLTPGAQEVDLSGTGSAGAPKPAQTAPPAETKRDEPAAPGPGDYMQRLLDAKKKAKKD